MATTQVILKEKIKGLGAEADVVKVKRGFARNFLLPQGKAYEASQGNLRHTERLKAVRAEREAKEMADAEKLASKVKKVKLKLKPDLWDDAGKLEISRGAFSRLTSALPGTLELERLEPSGARKMDRLEALPAGRYRLSHTFPAPAKGSCTVRVVAQASGTITAENHPAEFAALVKVSVASIKAGGRS